jgi:hypothetical protein
MTHSVLGRIVRRRRPVAGSFTQAVRFQTCRPLRPAEKACAVSWVRRPGPDRDPGMTTLDDEIRGADEDFNLRQG